VIETVRLLLGSYYKITFSTYSGKQNCHTENFIRHTNVFLCKNAYSGYDNTLKGVLDGLLKSTHQKTEENGKVFAVV
jgi:hypothetical protein